MSSERNGQARDFITGDGVARVAAEFTSLGPDARRARRLLAAIVASPATDIHDIVRRTGAPRREVEHLVRLMGPDASLSGHRIEVRAPEAYRDLGLTGADEGGGRRPSRREVAQMRALVEALPTPLADLDHVQATPETVLRRALLLDEAFELRQSRVLLLGDHDATSLAFDVLGIEVGELAVIDVDHRLLGFLHERSLEADGFRRLGFGDLRLDLPPAFRAAFDIVVTDPPYSPEGVGLFAARAVQALERHDRAHLLVAYGFPPASPALGLKVQSALMSLELVYEAVVPGFNEY
ncbi:MAG: bis-aminopropyl spermidine synthase family protein, partial [Actinomycetota bacterium]|nr:bis-aminopropyl spermidine synthase family protein [Actinomycetota bacterium]